MHTRLVFWIIIGGLALAWYGLSAGAPFVCDDAANRCTYRITVTEPTKKDNGVPLDNLASITIKTSLNGGTFVHDTHAATALTGGGTIQQDYTFATTPCVMTNFMVKASAKNTLGTEGPDSPPVTVMRDRTLDPTCAPAAPTVKVE